MSKTINLSKPLALDKATFCQVFLEPVFNQDPRLSAREVKERERAWDGRLYVWLKELRSGISDLDCVFP